MQAEVSLLLPYYSDLNTPFYLEFQDDFDDGFIMTTFLRDKNIETFLIKQYNAREIKLTYLEIEQIVLPMKINMMRSHPSVNLYKVIFYDELKKQFFLDSINDW